MLRQGFRQKFPMTRTRHKGWTPPIPMSGREHANHCCHRVLTPHQASVIVMPEPRIHSRGPKHILVSAHKPSLQLCRSLPPPQFAARGKSTSPPNGRTRARRAPTRQPARSSGMLVRVEGSVESTAPHRCDPPGHAAPTVKPGTKTGTDVHGGEVPQLGLRAEDFE